MPDWKPVTGHIMSRWAAEVSPEEVLPEYPRPQMVRLPSVRAGETAAWLNLNGLWQYAVVPREQEMVETFEGEILVPFPIESALSGVKRPLLPEQRLWYRRTFTLPEAWRRQPPLLPEQRLLLHFGAVDWQTTVWVNGVEVGEHRGGYDPFSFEIGDQVRQEGENELLVAVWDPSDRHWQERGKQVLEPKGIWYTAVSGIWQTVWLEAVPRTYVQGLKLTPDIDAGSLEAVVTLVGETDGASVKVEALEQGASIAAVSGPADAPLTLPIPEAKLWSPDTPHLYDLVVTVAVDGQAVDRVESYFGMRKFSMGRDDQGRMRLCLNNEPLFHYGPLDQGYWPGGLYTAPTDEALRYDVEACKELGFNMLRKHIKVEPARFYYNCDRLGMIVWQDMPNGGQPLGSALSLFTILFNLKRRDDRNAYRAYQRAGRAAAESRAEYWRALQNMVDGLHNFACIGMWVPFNEAWGQFEARAVAEWLQGYDPTRPVDHASGWFDQGGGDFKSLHVYFKGLKAEAPEAEAPEFGRGIILSEFGGYSLKVEGHVWDPDTEFGYKKFESSEDLTDAYVDLLESQLKPWIEEGLSGAVYTQTTDVEIEINGYLTYDRAVVKMDAGRIAEAHRGLWE